MRPSLDDLHQLVDIDRTIWGEVGIIDPVAIDERFQHNPDCVHVVKDLEADKVLGGVTMSPLADGLIEQLVSLQIDESDLKPSDYRTFSREHAQDCYIVGIVARQEIAEPYYASLILRHALDYLVELAEQGIVLRTLYSVATTSDGERLARRLGFSEILHGVGPLGDERRFFRLDLGSAQTDRAIRHSLSGRDQESPATRKAPRSIQDFRISAATKCRALLSAPGRRQLRTKSV